MIFRYGLIGPKYKRIHLISKEISDLEVEQQAMMYSSKEEALQQIYFGLHDLYGFSHQQKMVGTSYWMNTCASDYKPSQRNLLASELEHALGMDLGSSYRYVTIYRNEVRADGSYGLLESDIRWLEWLLTDYRERALLRNSLSTTCKALCLDPECTTPRVLEWTSDIKGQEVADLLNSCKFVENKIGAQSLVLENLPYTAILLPKKITTGDAMSRVLQKLNLTQWINEGVVLLAANSSSAPIEEFKTYIWEIMDNGEFQRVLERLGVPQ